MAEARCFRCYAKKYDVSEKEARRTLSKHTTAKDILRVTHYVGARKNAPKTWHMLEPNVEPYTHTVSYADGTTHTYTTLERPNFHFNAAGQMTHINLAADMTTQDAGCPDYDVCPAKTTHCACTNCKYADHAGTIIIELAWD